MEMQRLDNYLSIHEHDLTTYDDETAITYILFPIHEVHIINSLVYCVDTGALYSCFRNKARERVVGHSVREYTPIVDYKRGFKFRDLLIRSRGMVELVIPIPLILAWHTSTTWFRRHRDTSINRTGRFCGESLLVDYMNNLVWNRIITNNDQLRSVYIKKIKFIKKGNEFYVTQATPIQLLYIMA